MKKLIISIIILTLLITLYKCQTSKSAVEVNKEITSQLLTNTRKMQSQIDTLIANINTNNKKETYQAEFDAIRITYKEMEWAIGFFMPETNRFVNGPNLDEIEFSENAFIEAEGLQTLEEYFYPTYQRTEKDEIIRFLRKLKNKLQGIDTYFSVHTFQTPQLLEAVKQQVYRIITLGITGFDTPVSGRGLREVKSSLAGINYVFESLKSISKSSKEISEIQQIIEQTSNLTNNHTDKNTFNYLALIDRYLNPLSKNIQAYISSEKIDVININSAVNQSATSIFAKDAWNPNFFAPTEAHFNTKQKEKLGAKLFADAILSGDGSRSCQSCHKPELAFTDGEKTAKAILGHSLARNTPSLNYSNFQHGQFWDMRREDLESQSSDVIINIDEMHGSLEDIIKQLNAHPNYKKDFAQIYNTNQIENWQLQNVIASYIRSLSTFSSPFDKYMQGDKKAMTSDQISGFNLFVGKGKCATCHFIPLFNGTVPPDYSKTESEVLGTAISAENRKMSPDLGRGKFHKTVAQVQHSFKTPTLRNVALTAPYMHNGAYQTLEQVMDFYNQGGGQGFGFHVENQTLPADKLDLSQKEINLIISFLHALTDEK